MYIDAHHQSGHHNLISEPPRRVFFKLKSLPVMFSDYLFRGESDDTIITQAQANMDINLDKQSIVDDIETISGKITSRELYLKVWLFHTIFFPDEVGYDEDTTDGEDVKQPVTSTENKNKRVMYAMGIICAVGILLISVGVHVLLNSNDEEN